MFSDHLPCPCKSGLLVSDCSCKEQGFVPNQLRTRAGGLVTGVQVAGCYAAALNDCGGSLDREHPISKSVLKVLSKGKKHVTVSNHRWQKGGVFNTVGLDGLSAHLLCERHNNAMSPLDNLARRFVEALLDCSSHVVNNSGGDFHRLFNGFDIERWMLKVLCGVQFAQQIPGLLINKRWAPPIEWLAIIFEGTQFPRLCGMYCRKAHRRRALSETSIYVQPRFGREVLIDRSGCPIFSRGDRRFVIGVEITLFDLELCLFMRPMLDQGQWSYRTSAHRFSVDVQKGCSAYLHLRWPGMVPSFAGVVAKDEIKVSSPHVSR